MIKSFFSNGKDWLFSKQHSGLTTIFMISSGIALSKDDWMGFIFFMVVGVIVQLYTDYRSKKK